MFTNARSGLCEGTLCDDDNVYGLMQIWATHGYAFVKNFIHLHLRLMHLPIKLNFKRVKTTYK